VRQREEVSLRSPLRSAFGKGENEVPAKDAIALRKELRKGTENVKGVMASVALSVPLHLRCLRRKDTKCAKQRKEGRYCCKELSFHLCSKGLKHLEVEDT
jgi:hypothetical protein